MGHRTIWKTREHLAEELDATQRELDETQRALAALEQRVEELEVDVAEPGDPPKKPPFLSVVCEGDERDTLHAEIDGHDPRLAVYRDKALCRSVFPSPDALDQLATWCRQAAAWKRAQS